jgi:hypothetical protein
MQPYDGPNGRRLPLALGALDEASYVRVSYSLVLLFLKLISETFSVE